MVGALYVFGVLSAACGLVAGLFSGGLGFAVSLLLGLAVGALFFALASILVKQQDILEKLSALDRLERRQLGKRECPKCAASYDEDLTSCPHCGWSEEH